MTTLPLADASARLAELADEAHRTHEPIEITENGERSVVLLSADEYDSIMETMEILGDRELMDEIRDAKVEAERDGYFTLEQVTEEMRAKGRLPQ